MANPDISRRKQLAGRLKSAIATAAVIGTLGGWVAFGTHQASTAVATTDTAPAVAPSAAISSTTSNSTTAAGTASNSTAASNSTTAQAPTSSYSPAPRQRGVTSTRSSR